MITWPSEIDDVFRKLGFSYVSDDAVIRTEMQIGFAEARQTHSDPVWIARGAFTISMDLFDTFVDFYETTLKNGTLRFQKRDPLDETINWLWRFASQPMFVPYGGVGMIVSVELERIPATDTVA